MFSITRRFNASANVVWAAWTSTSALADWFGPKGVETEIMQFDLAPGGLWRSRMATPDGNSMASKFVFRTVTPPSRLVWEHSFADADGNIVRAPFADAWPLVLLTDVTFTSAGEQTDITLTWTPINASAAEQAFFDAATDGMTMGWTGSFDALDAYLARR